METPSKEMLKDRNINLKNLSLHWHIKKIWNLTRN